MGRFLPNILMMTFGLVSAAPEHRQPHPAGLYLLIPCQSPEALSVPGPPAAPFNQCWGQGKGSDRLRVGHCSRPRGTWLCPSVHEFTESSRAFVSVPPGMPTLARLKCTYTVRVLSATLPGPQVLAHTVAVRLDAMVTAQHPGSAQLHLWNTLF